MAYAGQTADLALSLDVIFHLVEEEVYRHYMTWLFSSARKAVVIYSSNYEEERPEGSHIRHWRFTDWVEHQAPEFELSRSLRIHSRGNRNVPENVVVRLLRVSASDGAVWRSGTFRVSLHPKAHVLRHGRYGGDSNQGFESQVG